MHLQLQPQPTFTVRPFEPKDCDATIEIFLRSIRETAARNYTPEQIAAWAHVPDRAAWARRRASVSTWIATLDGVPVGFSDLEPGGHLDMMFVHPQHQRRGVATLLLSAVERAARSQRLERITVEASLTGQPFFLGAGFVVVVAKAVEKRGQRLNNFDMEKRL